MSRTTVDFDEMGRVHATCTMAEHFEEAGRKLLVPQREPGEAGIGTAVSVEHLAPSWVGDALRVTARCVQVRDGRLTCECSAADSSGRKPGRGTTVQAVLPTSVVEARVGEASRRGRQPLPGAGQDPAPDHR